MTLTVFLSFLSLPPLALCIDRRHCLTCLCCAEYFHTIIGINLCNVHQHMCCISLITWMHLFTGKSVCYLHIRCRYTLVFLSLGVCPDWWLFQWFLVKNNVFWVISKLLRCLVHVPGLICCLLRSKKRPFVHKVGHLPCRCGKQICGIFCPNRPSLNPLAMHVYPYQAPLTIFLSACSAKTNY